MRKSSMDFTNLISEVRDQLGELYQTDKSELAMREQKAEILASLPVLYELLSSEKWQGERLFESWFQNPINNARLALYNTYSGSNCAFLGLMAEAGGDWQKFHQLAKQKSRLPDAAREKWLQQSCTAIAPLGDV